MARLMGGKAGEARNIEGWGEVVILTAVSPDWKKDLVFHIRRKEMYATTVEMSCGCKPDSPDRILSLRILAEERRVAA